MNPFWDLCCPLLAFFLVFEVTCAVLTECFAAFVCLWRKLNVLPYVVVWFEFPKFPSSQIQWGTEIMKNWKARPGSDGLHWFAAFLGAVSGFPSRWFPSSDPLWGTLPGNRGGGNFLKDKLCPESEGIKWCDCALTQTSVQLCLGDFTKSWMWQNLFMSQHQDPAAPPWIFQLPGVLTFPFQVFSHCIRLE